MGNQLKILQVVKNPANDGMTIVMASHFPDHAFLVADVVAILNKGEIAAMGKPDAVITDQSLKATYGVDVRVVQQEDGGVRKVCFPKLREFSRKHPSSEGGE
jgi:iron complex transport system ATP-binding protein